MSNTTILRLTLIGLITTSAGLLRAAEPAATAPPSSGLAPIDVYVSTGDNHELGQSLPVDSPAAIEASFQLFKDLGVHRVYWRGLQQAIFLDTHKTRTETPRFAAIYDWYRRIYRETDPDRVAVRAAHKLGLEIWGVGNLADFGSGADTPVFGDWPSEGESIHRIEHPEWIPIDKHGVLKQGGPIEFAYPDARRAAIDDHMKFMRRDGYDGLMMLSYCENYSSRFQDEYGYNEPVVQEFKKRYGIDIRKEPFTRFASRNDWVRLRGEYLTTFLAELKAELKKDNKQLGIFLDPHDIRALQPWNVPELIRTGGNTYQDVEKWVQDGVIDEFGMWGYCDRGLQERAIRDTLWLTRNTATKLTILTSSPNNELWLGHRKQGVRVLSAVFDDADFLNDSTIPKQPLTSLKSDQTILRMRTLAQIVSGDLKANVSDIEPLTHDPNVIVRRLAINALGKSKDASAVPIIEKGLDDPENAVRCIALAALCENYGSESVGKILATLERDGTHPLKNLAVRAFQTIQPLPREQLVKAYQTSKSPMVREVVMRTLANIARPEDLPVLESALNDEHQYARYAAAQAMGQVPLGPKAVEILIAAIAHSDAVVADRAAKSLGLIAARGDSSIDPQRARAVEALKSLFGKFGDDCKRVDAEWGYYPVGNALKQIGPDGVKVLKEFMDQTKDRKLADKAWKVLYIPREQEKFSEVTEKENEEAFRMRPAFLSAAK